jgi:hypothetical protein
MERPPSAQEARLAGCPRSPSDLTPKNKVEKGVVLLRPGKVTANAPHCTIEPPQSHHQNTTSKRVFSPKPPAKTPTHHKNKKI